MTDGVRRTDIAVVGVACRLPGAAGPEAFWRNLAAGRRSIRPLSEKELIEAGADLATLRRPGYVPAAAVVEGIDLFDAELFGFSPREAALLDPQRRLFLECAWEAFEHAGYDPRRAGGPVGVWASSGASGYLFHNLRDSLDPSSPADVYQKLIATGADFLATQTSFKLDLRGPSVGVQTACSSSLVAVHAAAQALLAGECDLALAGGVSLQIPHGTGYLWQEGMILSPDGHCRAFDAKARGTVVGSGAGAVVLARLEDALEAGATVHAILRGSAVNNDGARKAGFAAPSVEGQVEVIAEALAMAEAPADSVHYVEAHGTGTPLGDAVEVEALRRVFGTPTRTAGSLAIGSVKASLGHLDAAAGVTGLIKTVLALSRGVLPPSLDCEEPAVSPGPLRVVTAREEWPADRPWRAGISSFGIGGTNAHVVLEAAAVRPPSPASAAPQLLLLSARSEAALARLSADLADHLDGASDLALADVAFTLALGRRPLAWRRVVVSGDRGDVPARLRAGAGQEVPARRARVVFRVSPEAPLDAQCAQVRRLEGWGIRPDALAGHAETAAAVSPHLARPVPILAAGDDDGAEVVDLASEPQALLTRLGELWLAGLVVDWSAYYAGEPRRRVPLPTYPFERRRYWIEPSARSAPPAAALRRPDVADWFYVPSFARRPLPPEDPPAADAGLALVVLDEARLGPAVAQRLRHRGWEVATLPAGGTAADLAGLLSRAARPPAVVVHLGGVTDEAASEGALDRGLFGVIDLARALGAPGRAPCTLVVVSNHVHDVLGEEPVVAEKAAVLGAVKVIPLEYRIRTRHVDVDLGDGAEWLAEQIVREVEAEGAEGPCLALRRRTRWVETYAPTRLALRTEAASLVAGGTYLITGGLGGVGLVIAEHLARRVQARLVLLGRSGVDGAAAGVSEAVERCRAAGSEVLVIAADVADGQALARAIEQARHRFGHIDGVFHCAGVPDRGGVIHRRDRASIEAVLRPKIDGTRRLLELLADDPPALLVLSSSLGGAIPESKFGQVGYAAANEFLDALPSARAGASRPRVLTIDWSDWHEAGMSVEARRRLLEDGQAPDAFARWFEEHVAPLTRNLSNADGVAALDRALASGRPRLLVSPEDLGALSAAFRRLLAERKGSSPASRTARPRPAALGPAAAPASTMEERLAAEWQRFFDVETIGVEDDFVRLGGDSLLAVELAERIGAALGRPVDPHLLVDLATIRALAARLSASGEALAPRSVLVRLQEGSDDGAPLVLVHPIGGHPLFYRDLVVALGPAIPVFAFQARGLVDEDEPDDRIEVMAERYLDELRRVRPSGPYVLAGASFGGLVAFEMARRLRSRGEDVTLAMIDTPGPGRMPEGDPQDEQAAGLRIRRAAADLGLAEDSLSLPRLLAVWRANWRAMAAFRPAPFDGPLLFFRPLDLEPGNRLDYHEAWPTLVRSIETEPVPGDHTTMNRLPHVARIAERLTRALAVPPLADLGVTGPVGR